LGCSETYLQRLSTRHQWVARVDAFDAEQDRVEQRQRTRRIKDMNARHAELAAAALAKVRERIEGLDAQSLRPSEVARLLEVASRAERIARGLLPDEPFVHEPPHAFRADAIKAMLKAEGLI
jgi:hypothetical protein